MNDLTRRAALALAATGTTATFAPADDEKKAEPKTDRERVIAVGMTEADCWAAIADAAGKFFALPKIHVMDDHEVAHAVHVIQNKLLARPTYRKYLELAKAADKKK